ncbi:phenylacetate--CoA ligase family protein [Georgenia daeguensis]|uniref:Phenylacetate--CoA ligase family protein n=1 Tax=Georgenia daeguensis TaxID=908355 RepID=A0ABP8EY83_9MICO
MSEDREDRLTLTGVAWDAWRTTRGGPFAVASRQEVRLEALVARARSSSRFYADHYRSVPPGPLGPGGLRRLPAVGKPALMERFDDWVTDPAVSRTGVEAFVADEANLGKDFLGRYVVFTTSGSTGEPALLVQDPRSVTVMTGLSYARAAGALPPGLGRRIVAQGLRQAAVFARGGHFLSTTMFERRLRAHPVRRRYTRFFSVLEPLPDLVAELNAFRPTLLATYASTLALLTEEQEAGRLRISPVVVTTGGELLLPAVRRRAEAVFGCVVTEAYAASEAMPLALPCRLGSLHVNSDWFVLEPVDAAGRPVPRGARSDSVLVTNLANYVQPVIRYQLGDSVVLGAARCACGSPLPTIQVEGRTDDILRLPGTDGGVSVLPMALATVVEETPGVRRFQVLQRAPASLSVRLDVDPGADREDVWRRVRDRLDELLRNHGCGPVDLALADEGPQVSPRSGKLRHVLAAVQERPEEASS